MMLSLILRTLIFFISYRSDFQEPPSSSNGPVHNSVHKTLLV